MALSTNTGNQQYSAARIDYLARYLQTLVPGLRYDVARRWIIAEKGVNGNVLGVTYSNSTGQHLYTYSSQEAGLRAAASLLNRAPRYQNFLNVAAKPGSTSAEQLHALADSGWNKRYYTRIWGHFWGAAPVPRAGGNAQTISTDSAINKLKAAGITNTAPDHVFTREEAEKIVRYFYKITPDNIGWNNLVSQWTGKTVQDFINASEQEDVRAASDPLVGVGKFIDAALDVENWGYAIAFIVGVPLAVVGFYLLAGVPTAGQNA